MKSFFAMLYKNLFCRQEHFPDLNIKRKNGGGGLICRYLPFKKKDILQTSSFFYKCFPLELLLCKKAGLQPLMVHVCSLSIVLLPSAHIQISDCFISPFFQAECIAKKESSNHAPLYCYIFYVHICFCEYIQLLLEFISV